MEEIGAKDRGTFNDGWNSVGHGAQGAIAGGLIGFGFFSRSPRLVRSWCCAVGGLVLLIYALYDFAKSRTFAEHVYNRREGIMLNLASTNFYASIRELCAGAVGIVVVIGFLSAARRLVLRPWRTEAMPLGTEVCNIPAPCSS